MNPWGATDNDAEHTSPLPTAEEVQQADNPEDVGEESMNPWGATDNDAEHTSPLPTAEEVQQADNPEDVGEESMNPWGATDNDAEHTSPLPTAEEAQNADNPESVGYESETPWGGEENDAYDSDYGNPDDGRGIAWSEVDATYSENESMVNSIMGLTDAIDDGTEMEITEAGLDLLATGEEYADNHGGGIMSAGTGAGVQAAASALGLFNAIEGGDDWAITSSSVNLLKGVDFLENMGHGLIPDKIDIGIDGEGLDVFGDAIDSDDEIAIARASISTLGSAGM